MPPPATVKRIVCLANSRKLSGRCIAGKELLAVGRSGGWIRPVSNREDQGVSEYERQYEDGSDPCILDIIDVPVLSPRPTGYQQENWLLDSDRHWERVSRVEWNDLVRLVDPVEPLWISGHSSANGQNDRVPVSMANSLDSSLRLIKIDGLELFVSAPGADFGNFKRSVQGRFRYSGMDYWLRVTDPDCEREYLQQPNGSYSIGECCLTVSLGGPYQGHGYKLIAAVIRP